MNDINVPKYYSEKYALHWDPKEERRGMGTLLKKANHIAIVVSDIGVSLTFYQDIMGFQVIKRPNFDRYGAWLTIGNLELHLIKGLPIVPKEDNLIVPHIAFETDNIEQVLKCLIRIGVPFSRNVSVPDSTEKLIVTQYFIRDPDGYYIELCNCGILTEFCLNLNPEKMVQYQELLNKINITNVFDLVLLAEKVKHHINADFANYLLPEDQWAKEADSVLLENMLKRTQVYGDIMQSETRESIEYALKASNNHAPTATRIIKKKHLENGQKFYPPAFYIGNSKEKYKPHSLNEANFYKNKPNENFNKSEDSYKELVKRTFDKFDKNNDGFLDKNDIYKVLLNLHQNPNSETLKQIFENENASSITFDKFFSIICKKRPTTSAQLHAFFNMLDNDNNKRISCSELYMALIALNVDLNDKEIEEIFIDLDTNGDGYIDLKELENLLKSLS